MAQQTKSGYVYIISNNRLNKVNMRKEFFNIHIENLEQEIFLLEILKLLNIMKLRK